MIKRLLGLFTALSVVISGMTSYAFSPQLKYNNAGTYPLWTEESYYSSPAVCDVDNDGALEIIFSNYSITVLDAATGETEWKVNSGYDRNTAVQEFGLSNGHTWSDVEIHDINGDGKKEIITAHGHGVISVLSSDGYFLPGWPQNPLDVSARSVEVADLDGDGKMEIVVGYGIESNTSIYVYNYDGTLRRGWPQADADGTYTWTYGTFMDSITIDDLNYDGIKEIIYPSDLSFISVFEPDGTPYMANSEVYGNRSWGHIALYEDLSAEIKGDNKGWGYPVDGSEKREDLYKGEFGHAKARVADLDGDGSKEVIATTIMCNRKYAPVYPPTEYMSVAIFNADRTRYRNDKYGYNWETIPTDLGKPLVQNTQSIASKVFHAPTISDLDGDGMKEVLFNSYNGKVHCFALDSTEPYAWPYSLTKRTSPKYEYASPVTCADLDSDGRQEVIFCSYFDDTKGYGNIKGSLYILNYEGKLISKTTFPETKEPGQKPNGSMAAPVVYDIDNDGRYEIVINSLWGGICVYDI